MRSIRVNKQFGLAICLFVLLALAVPISGQEYLPAWFIFPPQGTSVTLFSTSERSAKSDGARILSTYTRSTVLGNFQSLYDSSIDSETWLNTDYFYYVDPERVSRLEPQMEILDSMVASVFPRMNLYLVGLDTKASFSKEKIAAGSLAKPNWIDFTGFERDGLIYGVGSCATSGTIAAGWIKAEESALFELLLYKSARIGSITKTASASNDASMAKIEWVTLKYMIEGLRVVERWVNPTNSLYYVLVAAPVDGIRRFDE